VIPWLIAWQAGDTRRPAAARVDREPAFFGRRSSGTRRRPRRPARARWRCVGRGWPSPRRPRLRSRYPWRGRA